MEWTHETIAPLHALVMDLKNADTISLVRALMDSDPICQSYLAGLVKLSRKIEANDRTIKEYLLSEKR